MDFPEKIKSLPSEKHDFLSYCLKSKDCEIFFSEIDQGTFVPEHDHNVLVLNFITEGLIAVEIDGSEISFKQGDWCVIPAKKRHNLRALQQSRLIEFWFSCSN